MKGRKIIIGDVHGCIEELGQLLSKLSYISGVDKLFFVGDLVNKGPDSKAVLDFAISENAICIMGNHELGFLNFLENESYKKDFSKLKEQLSEDLPLYRDYMAKFPLFYEDDDFLIVHAGLSPKNLNSPEKEAARIITRIRTWDGEGKNINNPKDPAWFDFHKSDRFIIFGHWAAKGLVQGENYVGLDSGCVYGRELSAVVFPGKEIVQVKAKKAYISIE